MLQKFVYITGALDFLVGLGAMAGALRDQPPGYFVPLMTLGAFLFMAAACLMWASKDMGNRAPVVFWQGLVRFVAVGSVLYAVPAGLAPQETYALVVFDGVIGLVYVFGMSRVTGCSFIELLQCKTMPAAQAA